MINHVAFLQVLKDVFILDTLTDSVPDMTLLVPTTDNNTSTPSDWITKNEHRLQLTTQEQEIR
jgi:tRNA C32,U32 (ribose-2'-O)-methylase TrmJ